MTSFSIFYPDNRGDWRYTSSYKFITEWFTILAQVPAPNSSFSTNISKDCESPCTHSLFSGKAIDDIIPGSYRQTTSSNTEVIKSQTFWCVPEASNHLSLLFENVLHLHTLFVYPDNVILARQISNTEVTFWYVPEALTLLLSILFENVLHLHTLFTYPDNIMPWSYKWIPSSWLGDIDIKYGS